MYSLVHNMSMSSQKSHFGVLRVFAVPPIKQNLGGKIAIFIGFLQINLIILPKCKDNNENVFLGSQDVYVISKEAFWSIKGVRNYPLLSKIWG